MEFIIVVLPAFIILAIGYIGQKNINIDRKPVSVTALYLMYPFLAFRTFYTNKLTMDYLYILIFCLSLCIALLIIVLVIAKIKKLNEMKTSAVILSGVFMNSGNYGTPIILFAFGTVGFDYAVIMMVIQSILMNTIGLFYAAKGSSDTTNMKDSLMSIIKMPIIYGALVGIVCQLISLKVPNFLMQSIHLIADATIPTIMLVLGMQLASLSRSKVKLKDIFGIIFLRNAVSPLIALLLVMVLPIDELLAKILIVLSAMPTAANTTMFALQFNTDPDFVSFSTLVTTVLSIVTVPIMLMLVS